MLLKTTLMKLIRVYIYAQKHVEVEGGLVEEKEGIRGSRKGTRDGNRDREQEQKTLCICMKTPSWNLPS